ncbi:hypothetical protein LNP00_00865 [Fructobacillus sp. M158]|uniref:hypothetical protein n=1 Tax=Fructobacillus parabroussonetiae TaxID=2713174 RepID=UPI00200A3B7B|nr:hypothetical protein [Fructobacillus parabroussonetiae]MCK8616921.1 hypothetical protein [Fructobacillus parabroussonetiae]
MTDPTLDADHAPASPVQKAIYQQLLQDQAKQKTDRFDQMENVMVRSLNQQKALVQKALTQGLKQLEQASNGADLTAIYSETAKGIEQVADPTLKLAFHAPTDEDLRQTKSSLYREGEKRKLAFDRVQRVQPDSLAKQKAAVDALVSERSAAFDQMTTRQELSRAFQVAIKAVRAVPLPAVLPEDLTPTTQERQQAVATLQKAADDRQAAFEKIVHVDPVELTLVKQILVSTLDDALDKLTEAATKQELQRALSEGLSAINGVEKPALLKDYQALTAHAKQLAVQGLTNLAAQKKLGFETMDGVAPKSLNQQKQQVNTALQHATTSIGSLNLQRKLLPAVAVGQEEIKAVAEPDLLRAYQAPSDEDRQEAQARLDATAGEKKKNFDDFAGAKPESVLSQKAAVDRLLTDYQKKLSEAQTVTSLETTLAEGQDKIHHVENPVLDRDYRPVTAEDVQAAKKELKEAAKSRASEMAGVEQVDPESLVEQQNKLEQLLATYEPTIEMAKTLGELTRTKNIVLAMLLTVKDLRTQAAAGQSADQPASQADGGTDDAGLDDRDEDAPDALADDGNDEAPAAAAGNSSDGNQADATKNGGADAVPVHTVDSDNADPSFVAEGQLESDAMTKTVSDQEKVSGSVEAESAAAHKESSGKKAAEQVEPATAQAMETVKTSSLTILGMTLLSSLAFVKTRRPKK